jgi:hypothetical protein
MTSATLRNEAAEIQELSPDQLDQVTAGRPADGGNHNDAFPAIMAIGGVIAAAGTILVGLIGSILRGE